MTRGHSRIRDYPDNGDEKIEKEDTQEVSSFVPDQQAVEMIEEASDVGEETVEPKRESRSDKMLDRMLEKKGVADLTRFGWEWGNFAHKAIQDAVQEANPDAEVEKGVTKIKDDGTTGQGRIDVLSEGRLLEIKTQNLEKMSDAQLVKFLDETARQIESYQWSRTIEGKPDASAFFEFAPKSSERREFVEQFLARRGIKTIWGKD